MASQPFEIDDLQELVIYRLKIIATIPFRTICSLPDYLSDATKPDK